MYYSCHCIKRNGLQHDCRRTGCQGEPACLTLPDPVCLPSQLARARGLADPAPLAAHMQRQGGGNNAGPSNSAAGGGKKFIVCELKGVQDVAADNTGKYCKCSKVPEPPQTLRGGGVQICSYSPAAPQPPPKESDDKKCPCAIFAGHSNKAPTPPPPTPKDPQCVCAINLNSDATYVFNEKLTRSILEQFENKEKARQGGAGPNNTGRPANKISQKECTRPGCVHWKPPPPCVWDLPCKADCFETPAGIQPGRNPWGNSKTMKCEFEQAGVATLGQAAAQTKQPPPTRPVLKVMTPECCAGCGPSSDAGAGASAMSGGPAAGMPVLVMKLC